MLTMMVLMMIATNRTIVKYNDVDDDVINDDHIEYNNNEDG